MRLAGEKDVAEEGVPGTLPDNREESFSNALAAVRAASTTLEYANRHETKPALAPTARFEW